MPTRQHSESQGEMALMMTEGRRPFSIKATISFSKTDKQTSDTVQIKFGLYILQYSKQQRQSTLPTYFLNFYCVRFFFCVRCCVRASVCVCVCVCVCLCVCLHHSSAEQFDMKLHFCMLESLQISSQSSPSTGFIAT
jgi:hypothetical protein